MARAKRMSEREFRRRFLRKVRGRASLKERENGDCVMLQDGRCTVYDDKPTRCTTFPFWKPVLEDPLSWEETAARCEGIGQGDRYSREEIEQMLGGDETPLREKHARPAEAPVYTGWRDGVRLERPEPLDAPSEASADAAPTAPASDLEGALTALTQLYEEVAAELPRYQFTCAASGNCCDFDAFGHRLYVTTLEAEHFFRHLGPPTNAEPGHCPAWGADRLCKAREGRMLGCRTFFCGPYAVEGPEALHERFQARLLRLHEQYGIPYRYQDITAWRAERMGAGDEPPAGPQAR